MAYLEKKKPVKVSAVYCVSETVGRETQTKGVLADDKRCVQESTTWPWVTLYLPLSVGRSKSKKLAPEINHFDMGAMRSLFQSSGLSV